MTWREFIRELEAAGHDYRQHHQVWLDELAKIGPRDSNPEAVARAQKFLDAAESDWARAKARIHAELMATPKDQLGPRPIERQGMRNGKWDHWYEWPEESN